MNNIRRSVEVLFESPIQNMSFVSYMAYINTAGKITARSLMDLCTLSLTYIEELEKKNEQYEANFKEIESILLKLVEQKTMPEKIDITPDNYTTSTTASTSLFVCADCNKQFTTQIALQGHTSTHRKKNKA